MGRRRLKCTLCRKEFGEENVSFFQVPKLLHQRQRWIDLTGIDFKISAFVCQDHFTLSDFINGPGESMRDKRVRLQPGAVPSLNIPDELRSEQWIAAAEASMQNTFPDNSNSLDLDGESPDPTCHICNKPCPKGQIFLYSPPRDSTLHARWNAACGMLLKEWARICERHFLEKDFYRTGKRKRLNENAIPSLFLYCDDSMDVEEENDDFSFQNVESIDEELIDIKPDNCDEENFNYAEYFVDTGCNQEFVSKSVQTSIDDDTQTCAFIQFKAENKIYSVHCFYCDEIFAIWDWTKFVKHIHEEHSNNSVQECVLLEEPSDSIREPAKIIRKPTESSVTPTGSSKKPPARRQRRRSPTPLFSEHLVEITKVEPEFFAVNRMSKELEEAPPTEDLNESDFDQSSPEKSTETISKKRKCVKDDATSDEDSDDDSNDSDFDEGREKDGQKADNSRKAPLPCHQIYFAKTENGLVFRFLELWKRYPILWQRRETLEYAVAITELTAKVNSNLKLTITDAGMMATLNRLRKWYHLHGYMGNYTQHKYQEYYVKCSEFLSPNNEVLAIGCNQCSQFFSNEEKLREHEVARHKQYCDLCQKDFRLPSRYRKHAAMMHEPPRYACEICGQKYRNVLCYKEHLRAHRDERNYVCDKCGKAYVRQKNLREHTLQKHPSQENEHCKRPTCAICDIHFRDYGRLSFHRKKYHMVLEGTIEELVRGVRTHHTKNSCNPDPLVRGKRTLTWIEDPVTKRRRVVCDVCGNDYARSAALTRHQEKQHGYIRPSLIVKAAQKRIEDINKEGNEKNSDDAASNSDDNLPNEEEDDDDEIEHSVLPYDTDTSENYPVQGPVRRKRILTWIVDPITKARRVICDDCGNDYARSSALTRHQEKQHGYIRPSLIMKAAQKKVKKVGRAILNSSKMNSDDAASDTIESLRNYENDIDDDEDEDEDDDEEGLDSDFDDFYSDNEGADVQDMDFQKSFLNDLKQHKQSNT